MRTHEYFPITRSQARLDIDFFSVSFAPAHFRVERRIECNMAAEKPSGYRVLLFMLLFGDTMAAVYPSPSPCLDLMATVNCLKSLLNRSRRSKPCKITVETGRNLRLAEETKRFFVRVIPRSFAPGTRAQMEIFRAARCDSDEY